MRTLDCIVVGGGFAGIHAVKAIMNASRELGDGRKLRVVLLDPRPEHLRKVLLFRPAVERSSITVPWARILPEGAEVVRGAAIGVDGVRRTVRYRDDEGAERELGYDLLVTAIGSVARQAEPERGGISLAGLDSAARILERWQSNLRSAATAKSADERRRLMTVAVAGAGITGIETAAELAFAMKAEAATLGLDPADVRVHLLNANDRLFPEASRKIARRLEEDLAKCGVATHHGARALREADGKLLVAGQESLPVGLTVWTLGLVPNPALGGLGFPLAADGRVVVDESYRVQGMSGAYAIGDCARVASADTGKVDGMTCKEAIPQARRLGAVIAADLTGRRAPTHRGVLDSFAIGLGPDRGFVWARKWGLDFVIAGKLGYRIKSYVWDMASLLR